jgi:hypothetical protein
MRLSSPGGTDSVKEGLEGVAWLAHSLAFLVGARPDGGPAGVEVGVP